jgi:hypothetical protein
MVDLYYRVVYNINYSLIPSIWLISYVESTLVVIVLHIQFTGSISRANPIPGNVFHRFFGQPEDFEIITEIETGTNYYKRIHNVI